MSEFLENLWKARSWRWSIGKLRGAGETIRLRLDVTTDESRITLGGGAPSWSHRPSRRGPAADVTVVASAADLYLLGWRRADPTSEPFQISGDATLFDHWRKDSAL